MSDTYTGVCKKCNLETDLIDGICGECSLGVKKPEKLDKIFGCTGIPRDRAFYKEGYNRCREDMERYYQWLIKQNYIRKDELPSEEEIYQIVRVCHINKWGTHPSKGLSGDIAKALCKRIGR